MSGGFDPQLMRELYRVEVKTQAQALVSGLLALEQEPQRADQLEACMRAAHSLKGAARLVDIGAGVIVAHSMEELFVAAQEGRIRLTRSQIDLLLKGVDLITMIGDVPASAKEVEEELENAADDYAAALAEGLNAADFELPKSAQDILASLVPQSEPPLQNAPAPNLPDYASQRAVADAERTMRVSAENLNRLLDLAGEALIVSRGLKPVTQSLQQLKKLQKQVARSLDNLRSSIPKDENSTDFEVALGASEQAILSCQQFLAEKMTELDAMDHRSTALTHRLYDQALMVRMRPFGDGLAVFPRMVRDVANTLGKRVRFEVIGDNTKVDRDILERLDAPLGHLLRNAVDHGIETPEVRLASGKSAEGVIRVEAHHSAGTLQITVSDDGAGIDIEHIRARVVSHNFADVATAERLTQSELLEFLFLPGFTMKEEVSDISGRGVGLDVVREMIKQVGGNVTIMAQPGQGTRFQLQLPLTLSVIRALLVEIADEPYAFSFAQILRATKVEAADLSTVEGRQFFELDGKPIGLVEARQILGLSGSMEANESLSVVVIGGIQGTYGVVVDRFLGARELVVQPLDARLGKIKDISAGALMEDGTPLLIFDAEDMVQSMAKLSMSDQLNSVSRISGETAVKTRKKRVLVVDDSFTVRELQRKLLDHHGYDVEVAVDGVEGWNTVRSSAFDLVISDVDMPRMDGIELVRLIKNDARMSGIPVMILSYKDREDDRQRGLSAGADYYLTKSSYQSDALIEAVFDLIGPAQP